MNIAVKKETNNYLTVYVEQTYLWVLRQLSVFIDRDIKIYKIILFLIKCKYLFPISFKIPVEGAFGLLGSDCPVKVSAYGIYCDKCRPCLHYATL